MIRLVFAFFLTGALFAFVFPGDTPGQRKSSAPTPRRVPREVYGTPSSATGLAPDVERRVKTFEKVWSTLRDNYFDPTFNKLDWNQIWTEFEPKARAAKSDAELHKLLGDMIQRLERSHLAIIPPEVYNEIAKARTAAKERERARQKSDVSDEDSAGDDKPETPLEVDDPLSNYGTGIHLRLIDNKFVISRMDRDSAGEYAGLRTGFVVDTINGVSLSILLAKVDAYSSNHKSVRRYLPAEIGRYFLNGEKDSYVKIGYFDATDVQKEITVRRERIRSQTVSLAANLPDTQLSFEAVSLTPDVGLIRFNYFALGVIGKFCNALTEFKDKKAIIIDLRGNLGGNLGVVIGLIGMLVDRDVPIGTAIYRRGFEKLEAQSKPKHFGGRVAVVVDGLTASAAEMLSSSLQESHRALVVGDKTAGEALPAVTVDLPTGARLLYPIANYQSAGGKFLEGNGVTPDQIVPLDRKSLLDGHDLQIETAVRLVSDDKAFDQLAVAGKKGIGSDQASPPPDFIGPMSSGGAPPPPPPARKTPLKVLGEVRIEAPPPPKMKRKAPSRDAQALKIINEFAETAGTPDAFAAVKTYAISGKMELTIKGIRQLFDYKFYHEPSGKYAEINTSPSTGEIRSIYDGKETRITTEFGMDRVLPIPPASSVDLEYLAPVARVRTLAEMPRVSYLGIFDRSGRKVYLIETESAAGGTVALTFDVESKMLVGIASDWATMSYSDFRKVGDLTLPFHVENGSSITISLDEIKLNGPIDPAVFLPKDYCFNKP